MNWIKKKLKGKYDKDTIKTFVNSARNGNIESVENILNDYPNIIDEKLYGDTALLCASYNGHINIVNLLIQRNANVNIKCSDGYTALHGAAFFGNTNVVNALLNAGADWTLKDDGGRTARDLAQQKNKHNIVEILDNWPNERRAPEEREHQRRVNEERERQRRVNEERENQRRAAEEREREHRSPEERDHERHVVEEVSDRTGIDDPPNDNSLYSAQYASYFVPYRSHNNDESDPNAYDMSNVGRSGEVKEFDDGTRFVVGEKIGEGASTFALSIAIDRRPKVLKLSQNDPTHNMFVLDIGTLKGQDVRPFGGSTRRDDYELYLKSMNGRDDDEDDTLNDWLVAVDNSFNEYEVKTIEGRRFCLTKLHEMEKEVENKSRDLIRFLYWYHLFGAMRLAHCDVAPRNVIITFEGPMIIDYGCTVRVGDVNFNRLPTDVTPAYYLERRGEIRENHDLKGFFVTACKYFGVEEDPQMMRRLNKRNKLKLTQVFDKYIPRL